MDFVCEVEGIHYEDCGNGAGSRLVLRRPTYRQGESPDRRHGRRERENSYMNFPSLLLPWLTLHGSPCRLFLTQHDSFSVTRGQAAPLTKAPTVAATLRHIYPNSFHGGLQHFSLFLVPVTYTNTRLSHGQRYGSGVLSKQPEPTT